MGILRTIASKSKRRYNGNGHHLDLANVAPRVVAMGYPTTFGRGTANQYSYRNPMDQVRVFIEETYKDLRNCLVVNLCEEREYGPEYFPMRLWFPFEDHSVPCFGRLE